MEAGDNGVAGFDVATIDAWLPSVSGATGPFTWTRLEGGHSNLTYLIVDSEGREFVIRRPPQGELLPKAHDMWREYRIIDGLWPTPVPVAEPVSYQDERSLCDAHFYVMGKVDGNALYTGEEVAALLDVSARKRAGESFVDTLSALHSIAPEDVGLGDLGRPDGYVARQLKTWYGSWTASVGDADYDDPRTHSLHELLSTKIPEQGEGRVVHGDFGPHNCLFLSDGSLSAVLDWEIATLGDPLADIAYSINAWTEPGDNIAEGVDAPTVLEGFPSRQELMERYAAGPVQTCPLCRTTGPSIGLRPPASFMACMPAIGQERKAPRASTWIYSTPASALHSIMPTRWLPTFFKSSHPSAHAGALQRPHALVRATMFFSWGKHFVSKNSMCALGLTFTMLR